LYFSGLPIDLRVVVLEPGITEDHVLLSEAGDSEERPFGVGFVAEDYVYNFGDLACLVGGAVHVVHCYGARDAPSVNTFLQMKSQSIKLPVAPESKSTLMECTSLVSVVLTSIRRMIDVPRASRVLTESRLGNLFSYFGCRGCVVLSGVEEEREGASIGSLISVLTSSMSNTMNLLTSSNQSTLFASRAKQNPPLGLSKSLLSLLYPSEPLNLQSVPPSAPRLTFGHPNNGGSPLQDGWPLRSNSNLAEVKSAFSRLRQCPWVFLQMVQTETVEVWAERKAELLEGSEVPKKGLVK